MSEAASNNSFLISKNPRVVSLNFIGDDIQSLARYEPGDNVTPGHWILDVGAQLTWFNIIHPDWDIIPTEVDANDEEAKFVSKIIDETGRVRGQATGTATYKEDGVRGFKLCETAESRSMARLLFRVGFGCQTKAFRHFSTVNITDPDDSPRALNSVNDGDGTGNVVQYPTSEAAGVINGAAPALTQSTPIPVEALEKESEQAQDDGDTALIDPNQVSMDEYMQATKAQAVAAEPVAKSEAVASEPVAVAEPEPEPEPEAQPTAEEIPAQTAPVVDAAKEEAAPDNSDAKDGAPAPDSEHVDIVYEVVKKQFDAVKDKDIEIDNRYFGADQVATDGMYINPNKKKTLMNAMQLQHAINVLESIPDSYLSIKVPVIQKSEMFGMTVRDVLSDAVPKGRDLIGAMHLMYGKEDTIGYAAILLCKEIDKIEDVLFAS